MYNIGLYAAPYLLGLSYAETTKVYNYNPAYDEVQYLLVNEKILSAEGGALMGVQFDITPRIVLDIFLGGGVRQSNISRDGDYEGSSDFGLLEIGFTGVKPRIGLQMGITF